MRAGDLIASRFEIEGVAGAGGNGEVYRAFDHATGGAVALKVLRDCAGQESRLEREARALAGLHHPGIVRYVAHGVTPSYERYLVMEWLEGEDLQACLLRRGLTTDESIALVARVAEALAEAHACGIVHRDLKPTNIFLVDGALDRVKVLDFGIARLDGVSRSSQWGVVAGTPGYMAPEQARSGQKIDARADVFALGCLLFECLTGVPAFNGEHLMALLAKILFESSPRLRDIRPDLPPELDALCTRMLAKDANKRPRDGAAVAAELAEIGSSIGGALAPEEGPRSTLLPPLSITSGERRLLCVLLMGPDPWSEQAPPTPATADDAAFATPLVPSPSEELLRRTAEAHGARIEFLSDGSTVMTIAGTTRSATDQAARAARCALTFRQLSPGRPLSLATGRAEVMGQIPVGDAIDRVAAMLTGRAARGAAVEPKSSPMPRTRRAPIAIDEVTAGLLDGRFEVVLGESGPELHGEREPAAGVRTLLGKPTAFVGRDREFAALKALFDECVEEPTAHVVLLSAPAGVGKSRLAHELVSAVRQGPEPVEIWIGRGDSMRVASAFSLLGQALRGTCGIHDGEARFVRQEKLRTRVARNVPAAERRRVTEFLGELIGAPFPAEESSALRAARLDPQVMGDQMCRAWEDFVSAECAAQPVLLVLEDLHWGDLPTVRLVDAALRSQKSRPFLVLSLGRPEVHERFPKLWVDRGIQEIGLKELTPRASKRLVLQVLGDSVSPATVDRLVTQSEGHAFYLEELIRAVAEGGDGAALPGTVLAMVQARLESLESDARRVLRAASVFGEVFWQDGVALLLGGAQLRPPARASVPPIERSPPSAVDWLSVLVEREVLVCRPESRFPGERELTFRHALLREGAYAMLTERDRALGHRLVGEWLEAHGETDPMVLAEHFERGEDPARAGPFYVRAAEQALRGSDTEAAVERIRGGLERGVSDAVRADLLGLLSEAHAWRGEWKSVNACVVEVMRHASPGSAAWVRAVMASVRDAIRAGDLERFREALCRLLAVEPRPDTLDLVAFALSGAVAGLVWAGHFELAETCTQRLYAIVLAASGHAPVAQGWASVVRAFWATCMHDEPWEGLHHAEAARASFDEASHWRGAWMAQGLAGLSCRALGLLDRALRELRATSLAEEDFVALTSFYGHALVEVLADRGALVEARREATRLVDAGRTRGLPHDEGRGRWALAGVLLRLGDLAAAEREALVAIELLAGVSVERTLLGVTLAAIRLAQGRAAEALESAQQVIDAYETFGTFRIRDTFVRLVHAEARRAAGDVEGACAAIRVARDQLLVKASAIGDPAMGLSFLQNVPENARVMDLARAWLNEPDRAPV